MEFDDFDGIILDIDGTIWNTSEIVTIAWNKAIDDCGFLAKKVNAQILQKEFGKTMDQIACDLWSNLDGNSQKILLSKCCDFEHEAIFKSSIDFCYEGVVETVQKMSASQNFFVVSNCQSGYIELMLEKTGLKPFIKDFECFGRTGKGKAENIILLLSRIALHSPVYVGDTKGDALACRQAGIPFIWASYGFGEVNENECIAKIEKFSDLCTILKKD